MVQDVHPVTQKFSDTLKILIFLSLSGDFYIGPSSERAWFCLPHDACRIVSEMTSTVSLS